MKKVVENFLLWLWFLNICCCNSAGGLHLNPVISMAVALAGKMKTPLMVIPMILAQFAGCLLGAGFYRVCFLCFYIAGNVIQEYNYHFILQCHQWILKVVLLTWSPHLSHPSMLWCFATKNMYQTLFVCPEPKWLKQLRFSEILFEQANVSILPNLPNWPWTDWWIVRSCLWTFQKPKL